MRTVSAFFLLCMIAVSALCADVVTNKSNELRFFVVSEDPVAGGRNIDTAEFPKLGYIRSEPDMVVHALQSVATNSAHVSSLYAGKRTEAYEPAVMIVMIPADAKRFGVLTRQNVGSRILLMLGDRPLIAPTIRAPIETPSLQLTLGKRGDAKSIMDNLNSLVRPLPGRPTAQ